MLLKALFLIKLTKCLDFNPKDMSHIEAYLENHTPKRDNFLNFEDGGQFPTGFECTFEEGLCDEWFLVPSQNHKDPMTNLTEVFSEWIVLQGPTLSLLTGPGSDHTTKDPERGRYLLAEGHSRSTLSIYRAISPTVDLTGSKEFCLSFWYMLYGRDVFSLTVELLVPRFKMNKQRLYSISGNLSSNRTDWRYAQIPILPSFTGNDQLKRFYSRAKIQFDARRGFSYLSDIALDDVMLRNEECQKIPIAGTTASPNKVAAMATFSPSYTQKPTARTTTRSVKSADLERINYRKERFLAVEIADGDHRITCGNSRGAQGDHLTGEFYHSKNKICCDGALWKLSAGTECCGKKPFFPRKQICCGSKILKKKTNGCCAGNSFLKAKSFCCGDELRSRKTELTRCCGKNKKVFDPRQGEKCCANGKVASSGEKCCGMAIIRSEDFCCSGLAETTANGIIYDPDSSVCCRTRSRGVFLMTKEDENDACCNGKIFNSLESTCSRGVIIDDA